MARLGVLIVLWLGLVFQESLVDSASRKRDGYSESWLRLDYSSAFHEYNSLQIDGAVSYYYYGPKEADIINATAIWLNPTEKCDPPASVAGKVVIVEASGAGCVTTTQYERLARLGAKAFVILTPFPAAGILIYVHNEFNACKYCGWEMLTLILPSRGHVHIPSRGSKHVRETLSGALQEGELRMSVHLENPARDKFGVVYNSWVWIITLRVVPGLLALVISYLVVIQLRYERNRRRAVLARYERKMADSRRRSKPGASGGSGSGASAAGATSALSGGAGGSGAGFSAGRSRDEAISAAQTWTVAEVVCTIEGMCVLTFGMSLVLGAYGPQLLPFQYYYLFVTGLFGWSLFTTLMLTVWLREQVQKFSSRPLRLSGRTSFWKRHQWLLLVLLFMFPVSDLVYCASTTVRIWTEDAMWDFSNYHGIIIAFYAAVQVLAGSFFLFEARLFSIPLHAHLRQKRGEGGDGGPGAGWWHPRKIVGEVRNNVKALRQLMTPKSSVAQTSGKTVTDELAHRLHNRFVFWIAFSGLWMIINVGAIVQLHFVMVGTDVTPTGWLSCWLLYSWSRIAISFAQIQSVNRSPDSTCASLLHGLKADLVILSTLLAPARVGPDGSHSTTRPCDDDRTAIGKDTSNSNATVGSANLNALAGIMVAPHASLGMMSSLSSISENLPLAVIPVFSQSGDSEGEETSAWSGRDEGRRRQRRRRGERPSGSEGDAQSHSEVPSETSQSASGSGGPRSSQPPSERSKDSHASHTGCDSHTHASNMSHTGAESHTGVSSLTEENTSYYNGGAVGVSFHTPVAAFDGGLGAAALQVEGGGSGSGDLVTDAFAKIGATAETQRGGSAQAHPPTGRHEKEGAAPPATTTGAWEPPAMVVAAAAADGNGLAAALFQAHRILQEHQAHQLASEQRRQLG